MCEGIYAVSYELKFYRDENVCVCKYIALVHRFPHSGRYISGKRRGPAYVCGGGRGMGPWKTSASGWSELNGNGGGRTGRYKVTEMNNWTSNVVGTLDVCTKSYGNHVVHPASRAEAEGSSIRVFSLY